MLRLTASFLSLTFWIVFGLACSPEPVEEIPDVSWDPEIPAGENMTILDMGQIELGAGNQTAVVTGTNNTEETISFEVECDFAGGGFLPSGCATAPVDVAPGESISQSAIFTPSTRQTYEGTFRFRYNSELAYFIVRAEAI